MNLPRAVLTSVPRPVGIVVFDDAGLLLDDLGPGACARHRRAQEDVDDEHDEEHDPEGDAQPQQPRGPDAVVAELLDQWGFAWVQHEHAGGRHEDAFVGFQGP